MIDRLAGLMDLERLSDDAFTAIASSAAGRMYGGEPAARALVAAQRTVSADRPVHLIQANYLGPGDPSRTCSCSARPRR